jgi:hypothetical protein
MKQSFRQHVPGKMSIISPEVFIKAICAATDLSDTKVRGHLDAILDRILANHDKAAATASEPEPVNTAAAQPAEPARKPRKAKPAEPTKRVWAKRPGDRHKKSPDGKWSTGTSPVIWPRRCARLAPGGRRSGKPGRSAEPAETLSAAGSWAG